MNAEIDNAHPIGIHPAGRHQLSSGRPADARNARGPRQPIEHAGRKQPRRTRFDGIQVVAGHDGSPRRQHPHQMRIAVIDDVEQIEIIGARPKPARIVPKARREPVGQLRAGGSPHQGQSRPASSHQRAQPSRRHSTGRHHGKRLHQHIGDQVHAVPPFLVKVTDNADPNSRHLFGASAPLADWLPVRRLAMNHACVARCGPSHRNGLPSTSSTTNCWSRRFFSTIQLKPL